MKVFIADDHTILREGLRSILEGEADIEIVGEADNGRTAVKQAKELLPDVVVMDLAMPDMFGIEAIRQIMEDTSRVRIVVLSMHSERRLVVEAINAGATGYLLKDCAAHELVGALRTVAANEMYLSPRITSLIVKSYVHNSFESSAVGTSPLSRREQEVLQLIAEGKSTKDIAYTLEVSLKTVEAHRQNIMKKLNTRSVAQLIKYAIREGLTNL